MDVANPNYNMRHVPVTYTSAPISQVVGTPQQQPPQFSAEDLKQVKFNLSIIKQNLMIIIKLSLKKILMSDFQ